MEKSFKFKQKLGFINGWRGVAILMVLFEHFLAQKISQKLNYFWFFDVGWTGVNLFFILSGFVLYRPYYLGLKKIDNINDFLVYYKNRFTRLYPLLIFHLLINVFFLNHGSLESIKCSILVLSTTSIFKMSTFYPMINSALWSIQVEIQFSIIFPFILLSFKKIKLESLLVIVLIFSFLLRTYSYVFVYNNVHLNSIKDSILGRLDDFIVGFFLVKLFFEKKTFTGSINILLGLVLLISSFVVWECFKFNLINIKLCSLCNNLFQLAFGFLIVLSFESSSFINRIVSNWFLQVLGLMCYSIYLWHLNFKGLFTYLLKFDFIDLFVTMLSILIFSFFSFRYIENFGEKDYKKIFLLS